MNIPNNITAEKIKFFEKQNSFLINSSHQFIIDSCKTILHNIKSTEDYENSIFELYGNKRDIANFYKRSVNSLKELYLLSSDLYNFKNDFFDIKLKNSELIKQEKKGKNLILKSVELYRNFDDMLLDFYFQINFNIGNKFYNKKYCISIIIGKFNKTQFLIDKTAILNFRDNYTIDNLNEQLSILNEIEVKQKEYELFINEKEKILNQINKNLFNEFQFEEKTKLRF